jgi:hypothetical protein
MDDDDYSVEVKWVSNGLCDTYNLKGHQSLFGRIDEVFPYIKMPTKFESRKPTSRPRNGKAMTIIFDDHLYTVVV